MEHARNITKENYQAYLLDYAEGQLDDVQKAELTAFLDLHPDCRAELEEFEAFSVHTEAITLPGKETLKKTTLDFVAEETFIGYVEGQLPEKKTEELHQLAAKHPEIAHEIRLYEASRTQPDPEIVYPDKAGLKKKPKLIYLSFQTLGYSAAAGLALVAGLWLILNNGHGPRETGALDKNNKKAGLANALPATQDKKAATDSASGTGFNTSFASSLKDLNSSGARTSRTYQKRGPEQASLVTCPPGDSMNLQESIEHRLASLSNTPSEKDEPTIHYTQDNVLTLAEEEISEMPVSGRKRKTIWYLAQKTLGQLNKVGVKTVDGEEIDSEESTAYDLTIGGVSLQHSYSFH